MAEQLDLFSDDKKTKVIIYVPIDDLVLSEFNPRAQRGEDDIKKLAERIKRNGFEVTRALWAYAEGDKYAVFAGGTRLQAAELAKVDTVPVVLHSGYDEQDIVRLAYEDNENDEYHAPVSIVDVWANYADLAKQGWKQEKIAKAVGVGQKTVSFRLKLNELSDDIKRFIHQGSLGETHLMEINVLFIDEYFSPWLTKEAAQLELCQIAATKGKDGKSLSVRETKKLVSKWKEFIQLAQDFYDEIKDDEYWTDEFIDDLEEHNPRSKTAVKKLIGNIKIAMAEEAKRKAEKAKKKSEELDEAAEEARYQKLLDDIKEGDTWQLGRHILICGDAMNNFVEADAVITDPPYGLDYDPAWQKWNGDDSDFEKIHGDDKPFDPTPFLIYKTALFFGADNFSDKLPLGGWVCWDKRLDEKKDKMFGSPFELAWFKSAATDRRAIMVRVLHGGVVNADSESGNNEKRHIATQKPIEVMAKIIEDVTDIDDVIFEPFAGSGTTLLACERMARDCVAVEIDPDNVRTIIQRWNDKYSNDKKEKKAWPIQPE